MIRYQLRCSADHAFEGWFRSGAAYDEQAAAGALTCPVCGVSSVDKAPMAPNIARSRGKSSVEPVTSAADAQSQPDPIPAAVPATVPDRTPEPAFSGPLPPGAMELLGKLRELRRHVEATSQNVGTNFAEEARKIHYGEVTPRSIYGDTTKEEAEALRDEGVEFTSIPWIPGHDA